MSTTSTGAATVRTPRGFDGRGGSAPLEAPSLVQLAADAVRRMILSGQLAPGDRLIEERLTEELGISRPPLREALRLVEREGLIEIRPRRGATVATLDSQDVYEILTLRSGLERMAVDLGVPVKHPERLEVCWAALREMEKAAHDEDRAALVESAYTFHASIVALAGHRRLDAMYASVQQQVTLCMARNLYTREHEYEDLVTHVGRHRRLLEVIEGGDRDAVLAELAVHGERSFVNR